MTSTNQATEYQPSVERPVPVARAIEAHAEAWHDWGRDPGDPDLLEAYIEARRTLRLALHHADGADDIPAVGGGPTVITPVIEWWTT